MQFACALQTVANCVDAGKPGCKDYYYTANQGKDQQGSVHGIAVVVLWGGFCGLVILWEGLHVNFAPGKPFLQAHAGGKYTSSLGNPLSMQGHNSKYGLNLKVQISGSYLESKKVNYLALPGASRSTRGCSKAGAWYK